MKEIVPPSVPLIARAGVLAYLDASAPLPEYPFLVGRRGYFGDAMGALHANDIGLYDDAIFLVEREGMVAFNANCDPGRHTPGIATLKVGRWKYRPGIHNLSKDPKVHPHYEALVQASHVTVLREGGHEESGFFGINIHCGGVGSVSSLGCQTIPPAQWGDKFLHRLPDFMACIHRALAREGRDTLENNTLAYILTSRYP
jgi:hypothetical protein